MFAASMPATAVQSPATWPAITQPATVTTAAVGPAARTAAVTGWRPTPGAKFNVARAGGESQFRLENQVIAAVNRAKPSSTIKMAMFSFDRHPVADALIAAKRRGVYVQVIVNGHELPSAQQRLRRVLGERTVKVTYVDENGEQQTRIRQRRNFFYQCRASCRGDGDVQHSKFVLFSRTGVAENVVMLGSVNMKLNGARNQFNDLLTINDHARLHAALDEVFDEMRMDRVLTDSYRRYAIGERYQLEVMPYPRTKATAQTRWTAYRDPIVRLLRPIRCTGARTDTGRTIVRVNMHAWDGERGRMLANKFRDLYAAGCDVKIHVGFAGKAARDVFARPTQRGKVPVRSTGFDTDGDGEIDLYSHAKVLLVNGNYDGSPGKKMVVTGSSNYQNGGQYGDELIFRVFDSKIYRQYADNWGYLWREHTHSFYWGVGLRTRSSNELEYRLYDGLGTDSPEWRDE
jgi:phosphatidylserine/phosphatidylglycerophosphate/cardiolipin synthase-like enzyme